MFLFHKIQNPPQIVFVNGPPRSGKDTVGDIIRTQGRGFFVICKFAQELKERTHGAYNLRIATGEALPHNFFEKVKDKPSRYFEGLTPRQAYISMSEEYFKPKFGADIFGRWLRRRILNTTAKADGFIITDSGFAEEAVPIVKAFDAKNCVLLCVLRKNCDFKGDSRSYLDLKPLGVKRHFIRNDGSIQDLFNELLREVPFLFKE